MHELPNRSGPVSQAGIRVGDLYERRGEDGTVETIDIASAGAFSGFSGIPLVTGKSPSPDGRWLFLRIIGPASCAGGDFEARVVLMSLKPAAGPPVVLRDQCASGPTAPGLGVWSADGRQLFGFGAAGRTHWTSTTTSGGWVEGPTVSIGRQVLTAVASPDDVGTFGIELLESACNHVLRSQLNPTVFVTLLAGTTSGCPSFPYPFIREGPLTEPTSSAVLRLEYFNALRRPVKLTPQRHWPQ
jgi:hypothetical protein